MSSCYSVSFYCRLAFNCAFRFAAGSNTWVVFSRGRGVFFGGCRELNTCAMVDQLLLFGSQLILAFMTGNPYLMRYTNPYGISGWCLTLLLYSSNNRDCTHGSCNLPICTTWMAWISDPRWQRICPDSPGPKPCPLVGSNWDLIRATLKPRRTVGSCTHHQPTEKTTWSL